MEFRTLEVRIWGLNLCLKEALCGEGGGERLLGQESQKAGLLGGSVG